MLLILVLAMAGTLYRCAKVTAPLGGPKDITPPKVLSCDPPNHSAHFDGNRFTITFDEYVTVDKLNQQLLISPPMKDMPDYRLKGKSLIVKFKNPLKPNTTYSIFFGDGIADLNEGNILQNFSYVFSTGDYVDSLSMRGQVVFAYNQEPVENATVMLYKNDNDTLSLAMLPLKVKPYYVSKTNKNGKFYFSGLADTSYLMFAVLDQNYSMTFDQPNEDIAFIDSMVVPQFRPPPEIDSAVIDTLKAHVAKDSLQYKIDSVVHRADSLADQKLTDYKLNMFRQQDSVQKLKDAGLVSKNIVKFVFNLPASDSIHIRSLDYHPDMVWHLSEWNPERDSLVWYLQEPHPDSLKLDVMNGNVLLDSLNMRVIPKVNKFLRRRRKKEEEKKKEYVEWKANVSGTIKPGDTLKLTFDQPIVHTSFDSVLFVRNKDTIYNPRNYFSDTLHRILVFPFKVQPNSKYSLFIPDSTITDWNRNQNKAIRLSLNAKGDNDYGTVALIIHPAQSQHYILQMLDKDDKVLVTRFFSKASTITFNNVNAGNYRFRVIFDDNDNGHWDPGDYFKHRQPERVVYFPKTINVRANWEVKEDWNLK